MFTLWNIVYIPEELWHCTDPGEKPQRILEDLQGSLKILKDLQKIFEDEDLSRIFNCN